MKYKSLFNTMQYISYSNSDYIQCKGRSPWITNGSNVSKKMNKDEVRAWDLGSYIKDKEISLNVQVVSYNNIVQ